MKRFIGIKKILIITVFVAVSISGYYFWQSRQHLISTGNAYVQGEIATISARSAGLVDMVTVTEYQYVKAGDVLVEIDNTKYQKEVNIVKAHIAEIDAQLRYCDEQFALQKKIIAQQKAAITHAQVTLEGIELQIKRYQTLSEKNHEAQYKLDEQLIERKKAKATINQEEAGLMIEQQKLSLVKLDKNFLQAKKISLELTLEYALKALGYTKVKAPISGYIGSKNVNVGDMVNEDTPLFKIVSDESIWIDANLKETLYYRLKIAQSVEIELDAYPDLNLTGRINSMSPATGSTFSLLPPENASGNFIRIQQRIPVKITFDEYDKRRFHIVPGMSSTVTINTLP